MRLPLLAPDQLSTEQRLFYDRALKQIEDGGFTVFRTRNHSGALLGPWGVFAHSPKVGQAHYDQVEAIAGIGALAARTKQVAILVVGARFRAAYELYAHAAAAARDGLDDATIATLTAGGRPTSLSAEESLAFDIAGALSGGGVLAGATYQAARAVFGELALYELVMTIGLYAQVCVVLNAFDVPSEQSFDGGISE